MYIHIIRHAETEGNLKRVVQTPDTPLSKRGQTQITQLAKAYVKEPISGIVSSDYARTQSTASAIQEHTNTPVVLNPLLRERNFGDLRGKAYDDIPHDFFAPDYAPINGETYPQFVARVNQAWQQVVVMANKQTSDLVVITHGLVVRCILSEILKLPAQALDTLDIKNTSITKVNKIDHSDIPILCDISHLYGSGLFSGEQGRV